MRNENDQDTDEGGDEQSHGALAPMRAGSIARRDFAGSSLAITNPITEAIAAQERAMVEARYIMAMRRPREFDDVRATIMKECKRPGFAEVATYARPVGREKDENGVWKETFAEGLSIRFAEVALRRMGNMSCTARTIHDDPAVRMVQVVALDYESGGSWETVITVPKTVESKSLKKGQRPLGERVNSYGDRVFIVEANEQRFAAKLGADISKASRTAILRLVPGEIQDEAFALCKRVASDASAKDPDAAKKRMLDGFGEVGIRPSEIVQWLGHPVEQGTRDEFVELSRILSALRERELVWSEVLAERLEARAAAKPKPAGSAATQAPPSSSTTEPAAAADPPPPPPQVVTPSGPPPGVPRHPEQQAAPAKNGGSKGGKGAAALKSAIAPKATQDPREAEPAWMAKSGDPARVVPMAELPPEDAPADGNEIRRCAGSGCTAQIEVSIATAAGARCYACAAADRDAE